MCVCVSEYVSFILHNYIHVCLCTEYNCMKCSPHYWDDSELHLQNI